MLNFIKMHGLGNDFIIVDLRDGGELPSKDAIAGMTDRKTGIGCDQLITMQKSDNAEVFMRIFNAPAGEEVEACGNATRCIGRILMDEKGSDQAVIETVAGLLHCTGAQNGLVSVDMGVPGLEWQDIPLSEECDTLHLPLDGDPVGVSVGNPHCVYFIDQAVDDYPVATIGPDIEKHPLFPKKTNVEFVNILSRSHLKMRVWERDAGETLACGTGACAVAVAAIRRGLADRELTVSQKGGDLHFRWSEEDGHILMTGPASYVFDGSVK